jgi:hypothetical protein
MRLKTILMATPLLALLLGTSADQCGTARFAVSPLRGEMHLMQWAMVSWSRHTPPTS